MHHVHVHVFVCLCVCVCVCVCVWSILLNSSRNTRAVSLKQCFNNPANHLSFLQEAAENPHWIAPAYKEYVASIHVLHIHDISG